MDWYKYNRSKAEVEIKERIQKPDIVEKDKPYNIKAKCDVLLQG